MLSMKSKYALRALIVMATHERKMLQSKVIAQEADVPPKFLEAILTELRNKGIVDSKRGIFGGYFLPCPPSEIIIGDVIRILDGTIAPLRCASTSDYKRCDDCVDEEACVIRRLMLTVRSAISGVLDGHSLATLLTLSPKQHQHIFW